MSERRMIMNRKPNLKIVPKDEETQNGIMPEDEEDEMLVELREEEGVSSLSR